MSETDDSGLQVRREVSASSIVLEVTGDLDMASGPVLEARINELRPLGAPLTLDVSKVAFVDSSGLRALTSARSVAMEDVGQPVTLRGCNEMLRRLLTMTGLSKAFLGLDD